MSCSVALSTKKFYNLGACIFVRLTNQYVYTFVFLADLTAFEVDGSAETPFTFQAAVETSVEKRSKQQQGRCVRVCV